MSNEELDELAKQEPIRDMTMFSDCASYACDCHFKLPKLVAEIRRLRAKLQGDRENCRLRGLCFEHECEIE